MKRDPSKHRHSAERGRSGKRPSDTPQTEADFQQLIAAFPELLAGDQIDADVPRRFALVSREQGIGDE